MRRQKRQHQALCSWNDLADELVLHVASSLDEASVARLGCTDHRTRQVCLDDRLWKRFHASRVAASARFCAPKRCMAHRSEAHRDAVDRIRRWLANPSDMSYTLDEWDRFASASLSRCGHHMCEPVDHRWACVMDRVLSDRNSYKYSRHGFARYPDLPYRAVGAVFKIDPFLLDFAASGLVKPVLDRDLKFMATYTGDTDPATGAPHGYGVAFAFSSLSGRAMCKTAGEWIQGRPNGSLCVWAKYKRGYMYYEGGYVDGRPHGDGLLVTPRGVYDSHWSKGERYGAGVARTPYARITYAATSPRGKRQAAIVYRDDGSIEFKGICDLNGDPVNGILFDRAGVALYRGNISCNGYADGDGTVYLCDGTTITGCINAQFWSKLITVTYPNGDRVECVAPGKPTGCPWVPASIVRFVFSATGPDPLLAGRTVEGPWHILQVGPRSPLPPLGCALAGGPDGDPSNEPPAMIVHPVSSYVSVPSALDAALDDVCADGDDIDSGAENDDDSYEIEPMRALDDFVFWPRAVDPDDVRRIDRGQFLDHMATHHSQHWSTCRAFAAALSW